MTEREMLELAAKAAGYTGSVYSFPGMEVRYGLTQAIYVEELGYHWNPLEDDGDALRLAVRLGIGCKVTETACHISLHDDMAITVGAQYAGNIYAATRLAITRAAAEISRAL